MKNFLQRYSPFLFMVALVFLGIFIGGFWRGGITYENSNLTTEAQVKMFADKVGKLVVLPEGETPKIAVVSNPEVLKNQAFFAEAKVGDIVLIYSEKAVLYDPVLGKVKVVAPVSLGGAQEPAELLPKFQGEKIDVDDPEAQNEF